MSGWRVAACASLLALLVAGCGGRKLNPLDPDPADAGDGAFDAGPDAYVPELDAEVDAGWDAGMDAGPDAGMDAGADAAPDAEPDAEEDAGPQEPPEPLRLTTTVYSDGILRAVALRGTHPSYGDLEIWQLNDETQTFAPRCEGGVITQASHLTVSPAPKDERLLVQRSRCGIPPTCVQRTFQLVNMDCDPIGEPVDNVVAHIATAQYGVFLLQKEVASEPGDILQLNSTTGEVTHVASGVTTMRFDSQFQVFWNTEDGKLVRRAIDGTFLAEYGTDVTAVFTRAGADEVTYVDGPNNGTGDLYRLTTPEGPPVLLGAGACAPQYIGASLLFRWPCSTGRLVLHDLTSTDQHIIAEGVTAVPYGLWLASPTAANPRHITYRQGPDAWVAFPPFGMGDHHHLTDNVVSLQHFQHGRVGIRRDAVAGGSVLEAWVDGAFAHIADGVQGVNNAAPNYAVLADWNGSTGSLLAADSRSDTFPTTFVASGVPPTGYRVFGRGALPQAFGYVRDFDTTTTVGTGTLELMAPDTGGRQLVDTNVTVSFLRVTAPVEAVVYAYFDGTLSEIRFAPINLPAVP
jgi:hypothetical protein